MTLTKMKDALKIVLSINECQLNYYAHRFYPQEKYKYLHTLV